MSGIGARRAWIVLGAGLFAYVVSVFQRSSLGVTAVEATERFGATAAELSTLAVAQLVVYAAIQVPAGVLLDRLGPRAVLAAGAVLMVAGQITLALSTTIPMALLARILVGAGDAASFISALRLVAAWFPRRYVPVLSQVVGSVGQSGQIISAFPFFFLLHASDWTAAYLSAASLSLIALVVIVAIVRLPRADQAHPRLTWGQSFSDVRAAFARPGTQLGFWSHFVTAGPTNMFVLLWGFPFLSIGLGYGPTVAAAVLTLTVVTSAIAGPIVGVLTARFPLRRSSLVLAGVVAAAAVWVAVLSWPGQPPLALVLVLVIAISVAGSIAFVGMDFARTFNPPGSHGSVTGFVNVGGFTATLIMMFLIGVVLDLVIRVTGAGDAPAELYSLQSFRFAFAVQFVVGAIGVAFMLRARRRTRRRMFVEEGIEVSPLWVAVLGAWRSRRRWPRGGPPGQSVQ